jgi:hypothetical protein
MLYEKPELFALSLAATAVRGTLDTGNSADIKQIWTHEAGGFQDSSNTVDSNFGNSTSSSATAYEAMNELECLGVS